MVTSGSGGMVSSIELVSRLAGPETLPSACCMPPTHNLILHVQLQKKNEALGCLKHLCPSDPPAVMPLVA